ncbi:hypothetical protein QN277_001694 [Acacia crassicarpa]|uniref:Putative plant transposon protein domain-containing protein n=1 Tax=Acacia crassicarpa TaxID=499986 RepID=A0AAE1TH31_9FABA|nr:hypothetical protein QN277_001694 [Acacia crassicarpa]
MSRTKQPNVEKDESPTPPPASKKAKTAPNPKEGKYRWKVQETDPKPKAKGIVINEPTRPQIRSTSSLHTGRGKGKLRDVDKQAEQWKIGVQAAPRHLDTQSEFQRKSRFTSASVQANGNQVTPSAPASQMPNQILEEVQPLPTSGIITAPIHISDQKSFKLYYGERKFCPTVYVDLGKLKSECNIDLSPWLKQYEPLLSIRTVYCPTVVKLFYFNMIAANETDAEGNIIEEVLETQVRGKKIKITAESINNILGITDVPTTSVKPLSDDAIFSILKPGEPIGKLNFKPASMCNTFRVIWFIYSRNMVQKGNNFTHFTSRDYNLFASIISQEPQNVGKWVLDEMNNFRFNSKMTSTIPFPNLVSFILFAHKVWYLIDEEKPMKPLMFGKDHVHRMQISFTESSGQSKTKAAKKKTSSPKADEAQSSQVAGSPTTSGHSPSFFGASLQSYMQDILKKAVDTVLRSNASILRSNKSILEANEFFLTRMEAANDKLVTTLEDTRKTLVSHIDHNFQVIFEQQDEHEKRISQLEKNMDLFGSPTYEPSSAPQTFVPSGSTHITKPPPVSAPAETTSVPDSILEPSTISETTTTLMLDDPLPSSIPPSATTPLPLSTATLDDPCPILKPTSSSTCTSNDVTFSSFLPHDKGGE